MLEDAGIIKPVVQLEEDVGHVGNSGSLFPQLGWPPRFGVVHESLFERNNGGAGLFFATFRQRLILGRRQRHTTS